MEQYTFFAKVYDEMMDNIPYEEWEQYLLKLLMYHGVKPCASITELGCGTGRMSMLLQEDGFNITGIDISDDMLLVAEDKKYSEKYCKDNMLTPITYINADMRDFTLNDKQDAVVSLCDSMNYLLTEEDLFETMESARKALKEEGIFIFDLKTEFFFKEILGSRTFHEKRRHYSYVWKNYYDESSRIHEYRLNFKFKEGREWREHAELHRQHPFTADEIKRAALRAGFTGGAAYDAFTFDKPRKGSERIYIVLFNRLK